MFVLVAASVFHVMAYAMYYTPHTNNMLMWNVHNQCLLPPITFIWARTFKLPKSAYLLVKDIVNINQRDTIFSDKQTRVSL